MGYKIEEIKVKNYVLRIYQDDMPLNPREDFDCNIGTIYHVHSDYNLGERMDIEDIKKIAENNIYLPVFLYDHSGISINTSGFHCPWDSGQVGIIVAHEKDIINAGLDVKDIDIIKSNLQSEIKIFDQYLRGDIYYYTISKENHCECCKNVNEEDIDSCGGFFGTDFADNGLIEHIYLDDKEIEKELIEKIKEL